MTRMFIAGMVISMTGGVGDLSPSAAQDKAERTGKVIGELTSRMESKNGRSLTIKILAAGEEKPRAYFVAYNPRDPKAKEPFEKLRAAVIAAKIGDRVQCEWVNAPPGSEGGFFVTTFQVLKKNDSK